MSKFYKGERVRFAPNMSFFGGSSKCASEEALIVKVKEKPEGTQYQIKGYTGFWPEDFFSKMEDLK